MKNWNARRIMAFLILGIFTVTLFYVFVSVNDVTIDDQDIPHAIVTLQPSPQGNLYFVNQNADELSCSVMIGEDVVIHVTAKSGFLVDEILLINDKKKIIESFNFDSLIEDNDLWFMMPNENITVSVTYTDNEEIAEPDVSVGITPCERDLIWYKYKG